MSEEERPREPRERTLDAATNGRYEGTEGAPGRRVAWDETEDSPHEGEEGQRDRLSSSGGARVACARAPARRTVPSPRSGASRSCRSRTRSRSTRSSRSWRCVSRSPSSRCAVLVAPRLRSLGARGALAGGALGALLAAGYGLQTAGLERTTVSAAGFVTGMYVVLTPVFGARRSSGFRRGRVGVGRASRSRSPGSRCSPASTAGSAGGDLLVLAAAALYAIQIVLMERFAPRYDPLAFTTAEMAAAFVGFAVRGRVRPVRGAARRDGLGRAARHGRVRERARVPRAGVGAAAHERDADRAGVRARAGLRRDLRLRAGGRPSRRRRLGRVCGDHGRDRRRRACGRADVRGLVRRS